MQIQNTQTKTGESQVVFQSETVEPFQLLRSSTTFGLGASLSIGKGSIVEDCSISLAENSKIVIGEGARIKEARITVRRPGAILKIGKKCTMYGASRIICDRSIEIGDNVWIGSYVLLTDSQIHSLNKLERRKEALALRQNRWTAPPEREVKTIPLIIEDDCFISDGAKVLYPSGGDSLEKMIMSSGTVLGANAVLKNPVLESGNVLAKVPARVVSSTIKLDV